MPARIDEETRGDIVFYSALDYDKQEIADKVGVSRNTVRKHLEEVREEVEASDAQRVRLATLILDETELLRYFLEQTESTFLDVDQKLEDVFSGSDTDE